MTKYANVTERIEQVRLDLGLNKSRFSSAIGIKPQTYNNFTGKQASKPNLELVVGIVSRFGVNPSWLLLGEGEVYGDDARTRETLTAGNERQREQVAPSKSANAQPLSSLRDNSYATGQPALWKQLVQLQFDLAALMDWCSKTSNGIENVLEKLDTGKPEVHETDSPKEG